MEFELVAESPFNLARCALVFGQFPQDGTDVWVPPRETLPAQYCRLYVIKDEPILGMVQQVQETEEEKARLTVRTHPSRLKNPSAFKSLVAWQFHLDADLRGFYHKALKHPLFRPLVRALFGLRPLRPPTLFEMAVIAITEQQLSYPVAVKMRSRLVDALGEKMQIEGRGYKAFPTPRILSGCSVSAIRALSFSTRKAEYIINLARNVSAGFDLEGLRNRPNAGVMETLLSLRGFGRWSAEYFISRGLGRPEVIAADDLGLQTLVGKYLGPGRRISAEECRRIMEPWGPYKRWAVFYLFCASRLGLLKDLESGKGAKRKPFGRENPDE